MAPAVMASAAVFSTSTVKEAMHFNFGFWTSIGWLTILTIFISLLLEYLVDAIKVAMRAQGHTQLRMIW